MRGVLSISNHFPDPYPMFKRGAATAYIETLTDTSCYQKAQTRFSTFLSFGNEAKMFSQTFITQQNLSKHSTYERQLPGRATGLQISQLYQVATRREVLLNILQLKASHVYFFVYFTSRVLRSLYVAHVF